MYLNFFSCGFHMKKHVNAQSLILPNVETRDIYLMFMKSGLFFAKVVSSPLCFFFAKS